MLVSLTPLACGRSISDTATGGVTIAIADESTGPGRAA